MQSFLFSFRHIWYLAEHRLVYSACNLFAIFVKTHSKQFCLGCVWVAFTFNNVWTAVQHLYILINRTAYVLSVYAEVFCHVAQIIVLIGIFSTFKSIRVIRWNVLFIIDIRSATRCHLVGFVIHSFKAKAHTAVASEGYMPFVNIFVSTREARTLQPVRHIKRACHVIRVKLLQLENLSHRHDAPCVVARKTFAAYRLLTESSTILVLVYRTLVCTKVVFCALRLARCLRIICCIGINSIRIFGIILRFKSPAIMCSVFSSASVNKYASISGVLIAAHPSQQMSLSGVHVLCQFDGLVSIFAAIGVYPEQHRIIF